MYVEELIERLACEGNYIFSMPLLLNLIDQKYITSFAAQLIRGDSLTEKQRSLAIQIIKKYKSQLSRALNFDVEQFLDKPQFRMPSRIIAQIRKICIEEIYDPSYNKGSTNKKILVYFPYDEELIDQIKEYKSSLNLSFESKQISWNNSKKYWTFALTESNILFLSKFNNFVRDEEFDSILKQIEEVGSQIENYIPMVSFEDSKYVFKNAHERIPKISTDNLLEILIGAKKYGISCMDETVDQHLTAAAYPDSVKKWLRNNSIAPCALEHESLNFLQHIIKFSDNILFIIPGGSELYHLQTAHNSLKSMNYRDDQMSVLFRLDSSTGKMCNDYIKENNLNGSISDSTKFVFVSVKLPKTLFESNKRFDLVVNFGSNSAHYTIKNFLQRHHNIIHMNLLDLQKR